MYIGSNTGGNDLDSSIFQPIRTFCHIQVNLEFPNNLGAPQFGLFMMTATGSILRDLALKRNFSLRIGFVCIRQVFKLIGVLSKTSICFELRLLPE